MNSDNNYPELEDGLDLSSNELLHMSAASLILYFFIATILFYFFSDITLMNSFKSDYSFWMQLLIGLGSGAGAAGFIIFFSTRNPVKKVLNDFSIFRLISNTKFSWYDRIQVSLFAGIGEELLFRGAIQPLLGLWITSLLFIAIHGYISFRSAGHTLFTTLLLGLSVLLGFLFEFIGLLAAMSAHAIYDFVMLWQVKRLKPEPAAN